LVTEKPGQFVWKMLQPPRFTLLGGASLDDGGPIHRLHVDIQPEPLGSVGLDIAEWRTAARLSPVLRLRGQNQKPRKPLF
jgi:hypothetical protein